LFRTSKGDDPFERRSSKSETARRKADTEKNSLSVAATALRWLKRPQETKGPIVEKASLSNDRKGSATPSVNDIDDPDDDLELVDLLDEPEFSHDAGNGSPSKGNHATLSAPSPLEDDPDDDLELVDLLDAVDFIDDDGPSLENRQAQSSPPRFPRFEPPDSVEPPKGTSPSRPFGDDLPVEDDLPGEDDLDEVEPLGLSHDQVQEQLDDIEPPATASSSRPIEDDLEGDLLAENNLPSEDDLDEVEPLDLSHDQVQEQPDDVEPPATASPSRPIEDDLEGDLLFEDGLPVEGDRDEVELLGLSCDQVQEQPDDVEPPAIASPSRPIEDDLPVEDDLDEVELLDLSRDQVQEQQPDDVEPPAIVSRPPHQSEEGVNEIERIDPLDLIDDDDQPSFEDRPVISPPPFETAAEKPTAPQDAFPRFFNYDDDDDLGDFDELGDLIPSMPPLPPPTVNPSSHTRPVIDPTPVATSSRNEATLRTAMSDPSAEITEETAAVAPPHPDVIPRDDATEAPSSPIDDMPEAEPQSFDDGDDVANNSGLTLHPIPELQSRHRRQQAASNESQAAANPSVNANPSAIADPLRVAEPDRENDTDLAVATSDEADDNDPVTMSSSAEVDHNEVEPTLTDEEDSDDFADLDLDHHDHADDNLDTDWHTHLAEAVSHQDGSARAHAAKAAPLSDEASLPSADDDVDPSPILPLAKPRIREAEAVVPEDDDDGPLPPLLSEQIRRRRGISQSATAETDDLTPQQLALGIIANVPRLRRFAAAQIGDETESDRQVRRTLKTALANPSVLRSSLDLGLVLIVFFYQQRRHLLQSSSLLQRSQDEAHAFETFLCKGLAGADQFEIRQFARAINGIDEQDRVLLVVISLENLSYDEVGTMIEVPRDKIMARLASARMGLRQALLRDETTTDDTASPPPSPHDHEVDIHGYLDGELDAEHMATIDRLIERDDDAADRLLSYGIQGDLIRRLYAPLLNRPIPASMLDVLSKAAKPAKRGFRFMSRRVLNTG